ncbi:MAG: dehydrogenase, partial [Pseudomonadota bacterium]|nr:dehydrogenase [Pseudomonadota bacterium]
MSGIQNKLTYAGIVPVTGLEAAAGMSRGEIISVISDSGHRGRGGAAFPTGIKWNLATAAKDEVKYIICNADEGEPGTFKDREILKKHADLVFEGMTIAGKAVGAVRGILYLRAEYNRFKSDLEKELVRRREAGLVGKNILGCEGFDF